MYSIYIPDYKGTLHCKEVTPAGLCLLAHSFKSLSSYFQEYIFTADVFL